MSLQDFERCTPSEFRAIFDAWHARAESLERTAWERARQICLWAVAPYSKKTLDPRTAFPLPWDKTEKRSSTQQLSNAELKERYEAAKKRYGIAK